MKIQQCDVQRVIDSLTSKGDEHRKLRVETHANSNSALTLAGNLLSIIKRIISVGIFSAASLQSNSGESCAASTTRCTRLEASLTSKPYSAAVIVA